MSSSRSEVFQAVSGERDYQEIRWRRDITKHNHTMTEYLVFIDTYVQLAKVAVTMEKDEDGARPILRKIAALAVAALEAHGTSERDGFPGQRVLISDGGLSSGS